MERVKNRWLGGLLAASMLAGPAMAEDIDLFGGAQSSGVGLPNVLFIVDNTANWGSGANPQPFGNEKSALVNTFTNMQTNADGSARFNVGVMFANETGNPNNNVGGGVVRAAIRPMNTANKALYSTLFDNLDPNNDKGNGGISSLVMAEAYRYFSGGAPYGGNGKVKADYTGNTCAECGNLGASSKTANAGVWALASNALNSKNATQYNSPVGPGCGNNFIIYLSNGPSQDNNSVKTQANSMLTAAGGSTTTIALSPSGSQDNPIDEWARFMKASSLGVTVYTIDVNPGSTGQGPGWTAVLKSMASVTGGEYRSVNSSTGAGAEIATAINDALSQIQAVNSVFASVSLPISVNTQGTYLNQVFIGQFRPDKDRYPRWNGNLKQYKLGFENNDPVNYPALRLLDAGGATAINNNTGFITECARSFWTPILDPQSTYWSFTNPTAAQCLTVANSISSDYPDGSIVERGAQSYRLRQSSSRTVKTTAETSCINGACTALADFATGNATITTAKLGAADSTERDKLINWATGVDVLDENGNTNLTERRPYIHGDVVHSRPVAIDYGSVTVSGNQVPRVAVFYGANDGMLRAVNGNRTENFGNSTIAAGDELWAFMPPEFYGSIKRHYVNTDKIQIKGFTGGTPKSYGMDGNLTAYQSGATAYIYAGMRRGGRSLYAFNVSNPTSPALLWKVGCPNTADDTGCTTGMSGIGQTWSGAVAFKTAGYMTGAVHKPMVVFGGGYDTCEDGDPHTCTASAKGKAIYILDAATGELLKSFTTDRGVVGEVALVRDASGIATYGYAADLGGNLYRISMGSAAPASWTMDKIASLGCATPTACNPHRKFMFTPDIVKEGDLHYVMIGSGDREKPVAGYTSAASVSNYFFVVKDKPTEPAWLTAQNATCSSDVMCLASLLPISGSGTPLAADLDAKRGWYLALEASEQVVTSSITVLGTVTFSTQKPPSAALNTCSASLGVARVYNISYTDASSRNGTTSRYETLPRGGLPPSPVAGRVTLDDGSTVIFVIGGSPTSALEAKQPTAATSVPARATKRVYWNIRK